MLFWVFVGGLALVVGALVAGAVVARARGAETSGAQSDLAVYKEQLAEVDRDLARGVLTEAEADAIRLEVSRRILDADRRALAEESETARTGAPLLGAAVAALVIVGGGIGLYQWIGQPGYSDLPLERRIALADELRQNRPDQETVEAERGEPRTGNGDPRFEDLMDRLREAVAQRPDDAQGLTLLAQNEARQGRFISARQAQEKLIGVKGADATPEDYETLLNYLVMAAGGYVSPEAEAIIGQLLSRDPKSGAARYYLGLLHAQTERPDRAFAIWRALLEESSPDAPWVPPIRASIESLAQAAGVRYTLPPAPGPLRGPTADDMAAAKDMSAEDRAAMIRGMVDQLSDRLANEGGSAAEWARLIRALGVLGDTDRAEAILAEARQAFAADAASSDMIEAAARDAGLQ